MSWLHRAASLAILVLFAVACSSEPQPLTQEPAPPPPADNVPPPNVDPVPDPAPNPVTGRTTVSYQPDTSDFSNPERGFHEDVRLLTDTSVRVSEPITLVRGLVYLDQYRHSDLPEHLLNNLQRGFDAVRRSGVKVVPRFMYNSGPAPDAPLETVLRHIEQLTPILRENADVISVLHAGFIGRWGEWHGSEYGLTTVENKRRIATELLEALPEDRMIQIRSPWHIRHVLGSNELFEPGTAFDGSAQSRIGFLNDCFLAGSDDAGTFDGYEFVEYAQAMAPYTVTGGETCSIPPAGDRQECPNAIGELGVYGWDYLNRNFYAGTINKWRNDGCFDEISRRLGYRFELQQAELDVPAAGNPAVLTLNIHNTGFGKLYNPRPLQIILTNEATGVSRTVTVASDARQVMPLSDEEATIQVELPTDLAAGNWQLAVALPDGYASLQDNPAYSIRFASRDAASGASIWDPATGTNRLGISLSFEPD